MAVKGALSCFTLGLVVALLFVAPDVDLGAVGPRGGGWGAIGRKDAYRVYVVVEVDGGV